MNVILNMVANFVSTVSSLIYKDPQVWLKSGTYFCSKLIYNTVNADWDNSFEMWAFFWQTSITLDFVDPIFYRNQVVMEWKHLSLDAMPTPWRERRWIQKSWSPNRREPRCCTVVRVSASWWRRCTIFCLPHWIYR